MELDIEIKNKNETITCKGKGLLLLPFINLTNDKHYLKEKLVLKSNGTIILKKYYIEGVNNGNNEGIKSG